MKSEKFKTIVVAVTIFAAGVIFGIGWKDYQGRMFLEQHDRMQSIIFKATGRLDYCKVWYTEAELLELYGDRD